jgi:uncharacterized surface protein with fasciclin (FAS1) repeats
LACAAIVAATGCASAQAIDDSSAAATGSDETSLVTASTATTAPTLPTLHEVLVQDRFVPLAVALERSGLDSVMDGLDDFVLLAPTGAAFASSGADIGIEYSTLMNNRQLLEATMRYHVVADPSTNRSWRTLNGSALDVDGSDVDTIERVDGVDVLDRINVRNGTVLVMPRMFLPTRGPLGTATAGQANG